jgi:hypothetical protein
MRQGVLAIPFINRKVILPKFEPKSELLAIAKLLAKREELLKYWLAQLSIRPVAEVYQKGLAAFFR